MRMRACYATQSCAALCDPMLSRVQLCVTPWTVAHLAPLSMGFSRQEYWVGCMPSSRGSSQSIEVTSPATPALQVGSLLLSHRGSWKRTQ